MNFSELGLTERISSNLNAIGYTQPTPIQEQAIPAVLSGKDIIGLAQTGTGKTAAFALPIIQKLSAQKKRGVRALIVAPTRELAQQIVEAVKKYSEGTGLKSTAIYGGVRMGSQLKRLREGVDIVVGCPGRLVDHIQRKTLDLSQIEVLVLDEADHMFDMGFLPDIKKLISYLPKVRQNLLFSATMPKEIRSLAESILVNPQSIQISKGEMAATVSHALFPVATERKTQLLERILKDFEVKSTIIFTRTKQRAKRLADTLQRVGYKVASLQGNLSQMRRQEAIKGFRDGKFDVLVATDLAARGIDVQQVTHVINFDIPMTVEGYTHRIGRTGRAAREGEAFTLISREDESRVRAIERQMGVKIERRRLDDFDYGADVYGESSMSAEPQRKPRNRGMRSDRAGSKFPKQRFERRERSEGRSDFSRGRPERAPRREGRDGSAERSPARSDRFSRSSPQRASFRGAERSERFSSRGSDKPRDSERKPFRSQREDDSRRSFKRPFNSEKRGERPSFNREAYSKKRGFGQDDSRQARESKPVSERGERPRSSGFRKESRASNSERPRFQKRSDSGSRPRSGPPRRKPGAGRKFRGRE